jgi:hypothetical protein
MVKRSMMLSLAAAATLAMTGCSAEGDKTTNAADDTHVVNPVAMTAKGMLVDENGVAVSGQTVEVNGVKAVTAADGSFVAGVTVYPNIEGSTGITGNLALSVADFSVTDATAGTTTNYLGLSGTQTVTAQAADGTEGGSIDNVLFQNLAGSTVDFGKVSVSSLTATQVVRFEDDEYEDTVARALTLTLNESGTNAFTATGTLDETTQLVTYSNLPAGSHDYYVADTMYYHDDDGDDSFETDGDDDITLNPATYAVTVDINVEAFPYETNGDKTNPEFSDIEGAIMNTDYTTAGSNGVWVSPTIDGTSEHPLVINFTEPVTVATDAISVKWAQYDTTEYDTADTAVDTAENAYFAAVEAALAKKDDVATAVADLQNYIATDENTSDNNTTDDSAFATKWSAYTTALAAYKVELDKLGTDLQTNGATSALEDADGTTIAGLDFSVAACDKNTSELTTPAANAALDCTLTYNIANFNTASATAQAEFEAEETVATTDLGQALGKANATFAAIEDAIIWNELTDATVTPTSSGDSVSIVTGTALPSSEVSNGSTTSVMVTFKQTGIKDASENILGTTDTANVTGQFMRAIYFNVAD